MKFAYELEFHHLLIQVNSLVASEYEDEDDEGNLSLQMPQILSQLTKELKLKPLPS